MKISVNNIFFALGATAMMASCSENSWNDHLDGFEPGVNYNTPIEGEFTMTGTDYTAVASNATNKALAEAAGASNALKAVGNNGLFSAEITGKEYLPAFLASSSAPYFLAPEGSKVNVTYNEAGVTDPIIAQIADAAKYTVSKADYKAVWNSDEDFIEAFAPMTPAAASLPGILKESIADAVEGQYAVVSYNEATENPIFSQVDGGPLNYSEPFSESMGDFIAYDAVLPEGLTYVWSWAGANYGMKASAYANGTNYAVESWLLSPIFTLEGSKASFTFEEATNFFTDVETAKKEASVWVRPVGGNWEQITGYDFPDKMSWTFVSSGEIDLSKYCGTSIQIGFKYTSDAKAGTWEIKNFVLTAEGGKVGDNPGFKAPVKKAAVNTPVTASKTAVYTYESEKWVPASGVTALSASDYEAMGFATNKLEDADIYLPLYLKANMPYAVEGDQMAVVYNSNACSVLVYDGQNWTINNDDLQTKTAQFVKNGNEWKFVKYVGKAYFNFTTELILDRAYLLVAEGICAIPTAASKNYGYMYTAPVNAVNGVIEQANEVNAFTFASSAVVGDTEYKLGEDQFFIVDSNGRYSYMSGTFMSFNLSDAPVVKDGAIDPAYVFTATCDSEGLWTISNVGNGKWIQYSVSYSSWGCYDTENGVLPSLYVLAAE
ncbi:MAG: hypothetical protein HDS39_03975 [Bacteroides sp.]|nr:hypothetical protein [Bacteroides sp.]